jgi:hypothetical protein
MTQNALWSRERHCDRDRCKLCFAARFHVLGRARRFLLSRSFLRSWIQPGFVVLPAVVFAVAFVLPSVFDLASQVEAD